MRTLYTTSSTKLSGGGAAWAVSGLLCFAAFNPIATYAQKTAAPTFADHRVAEVYSGVVTPPNFGSLDQYSGTDARCFGQDPSFYKAMRVNFAGHFVVSTCSCGTGCHYLFLWDAVTGTVYQNFPFHSINVGPYDVGRTNAPVTYSGEQYRADSSLLIVDGCLEGTCDCTKRYYRWSAGRFTLIRRLRDRLPPSCRG